jgi:hypothetical protein
VCAGVGVGDTARGSRRRSTSRPRGAPGVVRGLELAPGPRAGFAPAPPATSPQHRLGLDELLACRHRQAICAFRISHLGFEIQLRFECSELGVECGCSGRERGHIAESRSQSQPLRSSFQFGVVLGGLGQPGAPAPRSVYCMPYHAMYAM